MSSGLRWQDYVGVAVACPSSFPTWTKIIMPDKSEWFCLDSGGAIVENPDGTFWIDMLRPTTDIPFGEVMTVTIIYP